MTIVSDSKQALRLNDFIEMNKDRRGVLLPVLLKAREIYGGMYAEALKLVAEGMRLPLAHVSGTASFYGLNGDRAEACEIYEVRPCETRLLLRNIGKTDPVSAAEYASAGGYEALKKALAAPEKIIDIIKSSGLLGRGGAAFPAGLKWDFTRKALSDQKYVICNACEGEPATGKDRALIEADPHSVIEGMVICAAAVGADKGYIHIRKDYCGLPDTFGKTLEDAKKCGYLGENILGTGFNFDIELRYGPECYTNGEETGLIESVEGNRGEPRLKPPYPGVYGLWGKPTVINNVETFANIPVIINIGAEAFREYGKTCPGTKLFTVSGCVKYPGVYEFPMGTLLKEIYDRAGGCPEGKNLKAIQTGGGASGTIVGTEKLYTPMDNECCSIAGMSFGTGSLIFIGEDTSIPYVCLESMEFMANESCGKCTPCRLGNRRQAGILARLCNGQGSAGDISELKRLADYIGRNSLCGMGQASQTALLSALANFGGEFEALVKRG